MTREIAYLPAAARSINPAHHWVENYQIVRSLCDGYIHRMMTKRLSLLVILLLAVPLSTVAQTSSIVGTWVLAGADKLLPDGTRVPDYGQSPHGLIIFTSDGHYSVQIYRDDRPRLSSDDKIKVSPEEYKSVALGMSVHFGTYTVDPGKHNISFHIDRASWPNWDDTVQVRTYELQGGQLSWKVPPRPDGSVPITTLRRASDAQTK